MVAQDLQGRFALLHLREVLLGAVMADELFAELGHRKRAAVFEAGDELAPRAPEQVLALFAEVFFLELIHHTNILAEPLLEGQLDLLAVELHELTGVLGHQTMHNRHLFRAERSALLELVGERGEDLRIHAPEAHVVVVGDVGRDLLISRLIAEDGQQGALSPAHVRGQFVLQCLEGVGFIHHTYIMLEPVGNGNEIVLRPKTKVFNMSTPS
jgi:hypothetical protein